MCGNSRSFNPFLSLFALAVLVSGCAGTVKNMRALDLDETPTGPSSEKAMVVFMRPSGLGFGVQSSVFEIRNDSPTLVGIVAAKKKVAYQVDPGERLFMVVGESADFMSADLEAGKTYYALVTPRPGAWKARFSLRPIHANDLETEQFDSWLQGCEWVGKTPESDAWANENMSSIREKQQSYYEKWMSKDASDRPKLLRKDGR